MKEFTNRINELQRHWETTTEFENSGYEEFKTARRKELAKLILEFNPKTVLEIGCLGGYNLREIHKLSPSVKLTGYDINARALEYAKSKLDVIETIHGSIHDLADVLNGQTFDVIFTAGVLIHIPSWDVTNRSVNKHYISNIIDNLCKHSNLGIVHAEEHGEKFCKKPNKGMRYIHNFNILYQDKGTVHIQRAPNPSNGFEHFVKVIK